MAPVRPRGIDDSRSDASAIASLKDRSLWGPNITTSVASKGKRVVSNIEALTNGTKASTHLAVSTTEPAESDPGLPRVSTSLFLKHYYLLLYGVGVCHEIHIHRPTDMLLLLAGELGNPGTGDLAHVPPRAPPAYVPCIHPCPCRRYHGLFPDGTALAICRPGTEEGP